jgi:hypothetical protein
VKLEGRIARLRDLRPEGRERLNALARLVLPEPADTFLETELSAMPYVALVEDRRSGRIHGFCPLSMLDAVADRLEVRAILSGLTILEPGLADAEIALARGCIRFAVRQRNRFPSARFYWMHASAGRRRDAVVKRLFRGFVPVRGEAVPRLEAQALRILGQQAFGSAFDVSRGTVRFESPRHPAGAARVPGTRTPMPAEPSSGGRDFAPGEEIVYLAHVTEANLTPLARRMLEPA